MAGGSAVGLQPRAVGDAPADVVVVVLPWPERGQGGGQDTCMPTADVVSHAQVTSVASKA